MCAEKGMTTTPVPVGKAHSRCSSGSDVSMESVNSGLASPPHSDVASGPNVEALGAALEHPPEPVRLKVCASALAHGIDILLLHVIECGHTCSRHPSPSTDHTLT